ncbi:MAG: ABC transporter substrate-binding protein [Candidatus Brocadiaceae bacterium]|nr:ABC transporter substrate-binding protein [Candidatus Brocadiaceae bacterium]
MKKLILKIAEYKLVLISVVFLVIFSVGCAKKDGKEIKIGVIAPLTGDAAIYGTALKKGLDLAKDTINSDGGIQGKNILLIYEDSQADPKTAVSAFNKLLYVDKVSLIIGDMFSSTTLSFAPLAQKNKILLLSPTASAEEIPKIGDFVFSIYPSDSYEGRFTAKFVSSKIHKKTAAVICVQATAMFAAKNSFIRTFSESGGKVLIEEVYPPKTNDFRSILTKIKNVNPEVVYIPGYLEEIVKILKQAKEMDVKSQFITISTAYDEALFSLAGDAAKGLILSAPFFVKSSKNPQISKFNEFFEKKYGEVPNVWAAYGYDALNIASKAYKNSLTNNTPLNVELNKIRNYSGVTGKTTFLKNRIVKKQLRIMMVNDNNFIAHR